MKYKIFEMKNGKIQISDKNMIDRGIRKTLKELNQKQMEKNYEFKLELTMLILKFSFSCFKNI